MEECLPPELQIRIFSHLPSRRDIAASRLVSKQFLACSSQFLVPRVVIAKRLDSLRQFWQILHHPSLHRHVTELVWDASGYSESIASDFENYIQACDGAGRDFRDQTSIEEDDRYTSFCSEAGWSAPLFHGKTLTSMKWKTTKTITCTRRACIKAMMSTFEGGDTRSGSRKMASDAICFELLCSVYLDFAALYSQTSRSSLDRKSYIMSYVVVCLVTRLSQMD